MRLSVQPFNYCQEEEGKGKTRRTNGHFLGRDEKWASLWSRQLALIKARTHAKACELGSEFEMVLQKTLLRNWEKLQLLCQLKFARWRWSHPRCALTSPDSSGFGIVSLMLANWSPGLAGKCQLHTSAAPGNGPGQCRPLRLHRLPGICGSLLVVEQPLLKMRVSHSGQQSLTLHSTVLWRRSLSSGLRCSRSDGTSCSKCPEFLQC